MMLLFDFDGTLVDSNGIWKDIDIAFLARRGLPYTQEYYQGVAHTILPLAAQFSKEYCGLSESCEEILSEWMELARGLYAQVPLKPGVRTYLEQCANAGIRMAMVTSGVPEYCHSTLQHLQISRFFERVTFAQELGLEKKSADIWRTAAQIHNVLPGECMVFDDSLPACRGAQSAGMHVTGVYDPAFAQDETEMRRICDRYIYSFTELSDHIP